ncbi:MAG TPA: DUF5615 family PIN-like protein [Anaerolineae bacterium]|nr:DUF5615 family PIN-like protein [Anaerolineae bacterium]
MSAKIRYLLDENISRSVKSQLFLHAPKMEVICVGDKNAPAYGTPDEAILVWIEQTGYILVSRNRRTMPIHLKDHLAQGRYIPGILLLKRRISLRELIEELVLIWHASEPREYQNHIRYLPL